MAAELSVTIDATTGSLLVEGPDHLPRELRGAIEDLMGPAQTIACAAPIHMRTLMPASDEELARGNCIRVAGYWHDSLIEGPGRRTVVKLQGCPFRCHGFIYSLASAATGTMDTDSPSARRSSLPSACPRPHQQLSPLPFRDGFRATSEESERA